MSPIRQTYEEYRAGIAVLEERLAKLMAAFRLNIPEHERYELGKRISEVRWEIHHMSLSAAEMKKYLEVRSEQN